MKQSEFPASICSIAWGKSNIQGVIGFGFAGHRLKKLAQDLTPSYV